MTVPNPSPVSPPTSEHTATVIHDRYGWAVEFVVNGQTFRSAMPNEDVARRCAASATANARLIAAAPDLLAACKALMNTGLICTSGHTTDGRPCNCTCDVHPELLAVIDFAHAAIQKAGGVA